MFTSVKSISLSHRIKWEKLTKDWFVQSCKKGAARFETGNYNYETKSMPCILVHVRLKIHLLLNLSTRFVSSHENTQIQIKYLHEMKENGSLFQ